jgi:hypothetical protein
MNDSFHELAMQGVRQLPGQDSNLNKENQNNIGAILCNYSKNSRFGANSMKAIRAASR